jgi:hypothetical protein
MDPYSMKCQCIDAQGSDDLLFLVEMQEDVMEIMRVTNKFNLAVIDAMSNSNRLCKPEGLLCNHASMKKIDMLCSPHAAIRKSKDLGRFIDWLAELSVGSGQDQSELKT